MVKINEQSKQADLGGFSFSDKALNHLFESDKEVVFYALNDDRLTVTNISDSIKLYGYVVEEFTSGTTGWKNILHPDDFQPLMDHIILETAKNKKNVVHEHRIFNKMGETVWVSFVTIPEFDDNGDIVRFLCKIRDISEKRKLNDESQQINKMWQAINKMPDGTMYRSVRDVQSGVLSFRFVSGTWEEVLGVSVEASLADSRNVFSNILPEDVPLLMDNINESVVPLKNFSIEVRYFHPVRKKEIWIQISSYRHREGDFVYADGFIFDITARKLIEMKLKTEKERLDALGNNLPDVVLYQFVYDAQIPKMSFSYLSDSWEMISGVPVSLAVKDFNEALTAVHPDDLPPLMQAIDYSIRTLHNFNFEVRFIVKGEPRWIQISSRMRREGTLVVADGIMLDITVRKEAELKLELERDRFELLTKNLLDDVLFQMILDTFTGQMRMSYLSGAFESITGISADVALISIDSFLAMVHPDDLPQMMKAIDGSAKTMENTLVDFRFTAHGKTRWMNMSSRPSREGTWVIWDGILTDITQRKETENALETERKRLQMLGDNLPGSALYQVVLDSRTGQMNMIYLSGTWEEVTGLTIEDTMADISVIFDVMPQDDLPVFIQAIENSARTMTTLTFESRYGANWTSLVARPRQDGKNVIWDGIMTNITARKNTERELETEKDRLQTLGSNIPGGSLHQFVRDIRTRQMRLTYVSPTWEEITGVPSDVALADITKVFALISPEDFPTFLKGVDESARTMTNLTCEFRMNSRWLHIVSRPRRDGSLIVWDGIVLDITERKEAARALEIEKERLETMGNNLPNGTLHRFVLDKNTGKIRAEYLNSKWEEITGIERKPMKEDATVFYNSVHPDDLSSVKEAVEAGIKSLTPMNKEIRIIKNGKIHWLHMTARTYNIDNNVIWDGLMIDVTERKNNEAELAGYREDLERIVQERTEQLEATNEELYASNEELYATNEEIHSKNTQLAEEISARVEMMKRVEETEKKLSNFIAQSNEGITIIDDEGLVVEWNSAQEKITGILRKQAIGQCCWELYQRILPRENTDEKVKCCRDLINSFLNPVKSGELHASETEWVINPSGEEQRHIIITAFQIAMADNKFYMGQITRDITQQKLLDIELEQYRTQLEEMVEKRTVELMDAKVKAEESDRLKSAFLANMSHEIRTPLNGIVGFLQIISSDKLSPVRRQEYINVVNNSSTQLVKLIDDIIDVAKIEARQLTICPLPVQLNELMTEVWVFFETYLQANNKEYITLILDDSGFVDNCVIYIDSVRLRQVLNNLIGNAMKFTEKGFIRFGYRKSSPDLLEFVVEDSGIGLPPSQREVIFERFRQAELGNNRQYGGTGLGLTISRSLVQLKGGNIWVESDEGNGTSFFFTVAYLPVFPEDIKLFIDSPNEESQKNLPFKGKTVLVVEPVPMKFKFYEKMISSTGATVIRSETLKDWFDLVSQPNTIKMVFADGNLFNHEDFNAIKRINNVHKAPIVLIIPAKNEKYMQLVRHNLCAMAIEVPLGRSEFIKVMEQYL